jgi:hypothetical protein
MATTRSSELSKLPSNITTSGNVVFSNNVSITGYANVTVSVNSALFTVGSSFVANSTGVYHDTLNIGSGALTSNSTSITLNAPLIANGTTGGAGQFLYSNGATGSPYWSTAFTEPLIYDSLSSKFNGVLKDFVLRANGVVSGVYSSRLMTVTSGGVSISGVDFTKTDYFNAPIFFDDFTSGFRIDRSALVVNVSSSSISTSEDVYQLDSNNCVIYTAKCVESNSTSVILTNVRKAGSTIETNTSPVVVGSLLGRKGGSATIANSTVSFVSVINFANAPTKYNRTIEIKRNSSSDVSTTATRVFASIIPFSPINIMLSE